MAVCSLRSHEAQGPRLRDFRSAQSRSARDDSAGVVMRRSKPRHKIPPLRVIWLRSNHTSLGMTVQGWWSHPFLLTDIQRHAISTYVSSRAERRVRLRTGGGVERSCGGGGSLRSHEAQGPSTARDFRSAQSRFARDDSSGGGGEEIEIKHKVPRLRIVLRTILRSG